MTPKTTVLILHDENLCEKEFAIASAIATLKDLKPEFLTDEARHYIGDTNG